MGAKRWLLTLTATAVVVIGCSGGGASSPRGDGSSAAPGGSVAAAAGAGAAAVPAVPAVPRPAVLADLALVELLSPPVTGAGLVPTFEWAPVDGAATYRLTVLGPDGPRWGWEGAETSIRFGAVAEGQRGPVIVPGSWWTVAAIDTEGALLAASDVRPVSPSEDPGPAPAWVSGGGASAAASGGGDPAPPGEPAAAGPITTETVRPCSLLTTEQLTGVIAGEWSEPEESLYPGGKGGSCSWTYAASQFGGGMSISVSKAEAYNPAGWNGESDPLVEGIGEESYLTRSGMDRKVGFRRGEVSILLSFDYGEIDFEAYAEVARLVDEALQ